MARSELATASGRGAAGLEARPRTATPPPTPPHERIVQFGGDRLFPPFEWLDENAEPQGFQVELVRAIAAKVNMGVEVRLGSWSEIRAEFEDGAIDVVGMFDAAPRGSAAVFGDPHTVAASEIFVRRGEGDYRTLEDLDGKRVIVQEAGLAADRFAAEHPLVRLIKVATEAEALGLLASGEGDAAVVTQHGGRGAMRTLGLRNITTTGPPVLTSGYALCVRAGNEELLAKLNQGLAILKRTGEYNELYERWFGEIDRPAVSVRRLMIYGAVGAGLVGAYVLSSLVWTRLLRRRVEQRTRQLRAELGERARVQAELERSERRFRELIEHAPEAILVIDPRGREAGGAAVIAVANPRAEALFGLSRDDLLRADPRGLLDVDWGAQGDTVPARPIEVRVRRSDGVEVDCELRIASLPDAGSVLIRASLVDVTERKRAERRQRVMGDELDHRVKNTLASIVGLSEALLGGSGSLAEFRERFLPRVHVMARAHEALAASKWEGVPLSVALEVVVRTIAGPLAGRIERSGDDPLIGPGQALAVCLVLQELIENSMRHGVLSRAAGGVELSCAGSSRRVRLRWSEAFDVDVGDGGESDGAITEGFGLGLVRGLVEHQLRGRVNIAGGAGRYVLEAEFAPEGVDTRGGGAETGPPGG